ncbi:MAG: PKD domain-containing protein, partial [Bacteroidetes bacterium HGW-Bacteroidetes-23]
NYIGVGVGPQISAIINQRTTTNQSTLFYAPIFENQEFTPGEEIEDTRQSASEIFETKTFEKFRTQVFADVTFGFARIGPSVGIRYMMDFKQDFNYWQFYAIWKF